MNNIDVKSSVEAEICVITGSDKSTVEKKIKAIRKEFVEGIDEHSFCQRLCENIDDERCRAFVVFKGREDFLDQTSDENIRFVDFSDSKQTNGKTALLFPGNGIYQKKMLEFLCKVSPYFSDRINELALIAKNACGVTLLDDKIKNEITKQLIVFVSELVIAEFWEKCGCKVDYMIGHSMGEYAIACFSGIISSDNALKLLVERGTVMRKCSTYRMTAIQLSAEKLLELSNSLGLKIEIAAYNAPELVTASGKKHEISILQSELKERNIQYNPVNIEYGGHFSTLQCFTADFIKKAANVAFKEPQGKIISTVYPEKSIDIMKTSEYWAEHIYKPVRFSQALGKLPINEISRFIDVGVTPTLLGMTMKNIRKKDISWIPTVRAGRNYRNQLYRALGLAFNSGVNINWDYIYRQ